MHLELFPLQHPPVHRVRHPLGLEHMQRLECLAQLEARVVHHDLLGQVIVRLHGWGKGAALVGCFVRFGRACGLRLAGSGVGRWEVDREDLARVRVDDGDKVARVGVEVVVWSETNENETLLQPAAREALVCAYAPA